MVVVGGSVFEVCECVVVNEICMGIFEVVLISLVESDVL